MDSMALVPAGVFLALGTLVMVGAAWVLRRRPSHERAVILGVLGVVGLGFAMGWVVLLLTG